MTTRKVRPVVERTADRWLARAAFVGLALAAVLLSALSTVDQVAFVYGGL